MTDIKTIILSHRKYSENAIFSLDAMSNKKSLNVNPFNNEIKGDFIYLTNRNFTRYSFLYDNLNEGEVYHNCNFSSGYTSLLICEKLEYFKNDKMHFARLTNGFDENELEGKYCVFQNPLDKLFEYGSDDIVGIYSDYKTARTHCKLLNVQTSVLLVKIKAHMNWH